MFFRKSRRNFYGANIVSALENSPVLSGRLEQRQQLSPVQRHALEILALPLAALETRLANEFAVNPALDELPPDSAPEPTAPEADRAAEDENDYETNSLCADDWADELPIPAAAGNDADRPDFLGNSPAPPPSLKSLLVDELNISDCPRRLYAPALEIISALNDDGLLASNPADIAMACDTELADVLDALKFVQDIAPAGVAARDTAECLKLQLIRRNRLTPQLDRLLTDGREDLEKNRLPALCAKLGVTPAELEDMLAVLRSLDPAPGRDLRDTATEVRPDLEIVRIAPGEYRASVLRESRNRVIVAPLYEKMLEKPGLSAADREYLTEKISRAKELVQAIALRENTLKRIGDVLIAEQRDFLEHGPARLRPLTMKQTAEKLDLSESTISRAVADKFVITPQGFYPLRYFFSGGFSTGSGDELAAQAVKEQIRQAIAAEDPRHPLSDDALAQLLKSRGLSVARRTVTKYRESLKLPTSSLRKKHF